VTARSSDVSELALLPGGLARKVCPMVVTPQPAHGYLIQSLRAAADVLEQRLTLSSGLAPDHMTILMYLAAHQPSTIPDVASAAGHHYRWAQAGLASLREAGWVVRCSSAPARFALSDGGMELADDLTAAVDETIVSVLGWPAVVITERVLDLLATPVQDVVRIEAGTAIASLSNTAVAAECIGVEPRVIEAWVRSGSLSAPPWTEDNLDEMRRLRGSVRAVWPELLDGARAGDKFSNLTTGLGLTTQKVASAIWRDPILRTQLDDALMQGRDTKIQHGRRLAYREGCWCPECRRAQLGR
jgi:hypothetical protein